MALKYNASLQSLQTLQTFNFYYYSSLYVRKYQQLPRLQFMLINLAPLSASSSLQISNLSFQCASLVYRIIFLILSSPVLSCSISNSTILSRHATFFYQSPLSSFTTHSLLHSLHKTHPLL